MVTIAVKFEVMDIKKIEQELEKFIYELETEDRLVRVGLKEKSESELIYQKYRDLFKKETIETLGAQIKKTKSSKKNGDILQRIYFTLCGSFIGLSLAGDEDKIKTYFSRSKVKVDGQTMVYFELAPKIAKEPLFGKRELYDDAAGKVVLGVNARQLAVLKQEVKLIKSLGFDGYIDYFSKAKKIDYAKFAQVVKSLIKETDEIWGKVIQKVSLEVFGRPFKNMRACHMGYLRSISMYDDYYPQGKVVSTFERWLEDCGLSDLLTRIKIDDAPRPNKNPRAVCYWPKPPTEVHLVIKPIGGEQDFEAMFHEGGHALHGAAVDNDLPYSLKTLAHSNALTETYAFILENLVFNPNFLTTYLGVSAFTGSRIKWQAYFVNLMMLRRYLGKFLYEYEMFAKNKLAAGPGVYAKSLQATTGFVTKKLNYLVDMDRGFYSSEYLRAWLASSQIEDFLVKKFGEKWFVNKKAGEFLRRLYARGVSDEVEDVVKRLGYKPWDVSLLVSGYQKVLI